MRTNNGQNFATGSESVIEAGLGYTALRDDGMGKYGTIGDGKTVDTVWYDR